MGLLLTVNPFICENKVLNVMPIKIKKDASISMEHKIRKQEYNWDSKCLCSSYKIRKTQNEHLIIIC